MTRRIDNMVGRRQPSRLLLTTDSRRSHRFVKPDRRFDFRLKDRHGRLPETSGRKCRIRAPHIKPKPTRGATNAINIAAAKIARTTSDRHRAMRRVRLHGFPTERPVAYESSERWSYFCFRLSRNNSILCSIAASSKRTVHWS